MYKLILLRHGESVWNKKNIFTGWTDVDLSQNGVKEAEMAARLLKKENLYFDFAFTSVLKRAIRTLWIVQDKMDLMWVPVKRNWRLNERHYGALQGLNKEGMVKKVGFEQVFKWRRSYDVRPPALKLSDKRHPIHEEKYKNVKRNFLPSTESLHDCVNRVMPYWYSSIVPKIKTNLVIVSAHGNSLRGIVKHLDGLSKREVEKLNIPTGYPLIYELNNKLNPVNKYYLGNQKEIDKAIHKVESQIK